MPIQRQGAAQHFSIESFRRVLGGLCWVIPAGRSCFAAFGSALVLFGAPAFAARLVADRALSSVPLSILHAAQTADGGFVALGRKPQGVGRLTLIKAGAQGEILLSREIDIATPDGQCSSLTGPVTEDAAGQLVVFGTREVGTILGQGHKARGTKLVEPCLARFGAGGDLLVARSYRLPNAVVLRLVRFAVSKDGIAVAAAADSVFTGQATPTGEKRIASSVVLSVRPDLGLAWSKDQRMGDLPGHAQSLAFDPRTGELVLLFKSAESGSSEYPGTAAEKIHFRADGKVEDLNGSVRLPTGGNPVAGEPQPRQQLCGFKADGVNRCVPVPESLTADFWWSSLDATDAKVRRWSNGHFNRWPRLEWTGRELRTSHLALDPASRQPRLRLVKWSDALAPLGHVDLMLPAAPASFGVVTREDTARMIEDRRIEDQVRQGGIRIATATAKGVSSEEAGVPAHLSPILIAPGPRAGEVWLLGDPRTATDVPRLLRYELAK